MQAESSVMVSGRPRASVSIVEQGGGKAAPSAMVSGRPRASVSISETGRWCRRLAADQVDIGKDRHPL